MTICCLAVDPCPQWKYGEGTLLIAKMGQRLVRKHHHPTAGLISFHNLDGAALVIVIARNSTPGTGYGNISAAFTPLSTLAASVP